MRAGYPRNGYSPQTARLCHRFNEIQSIENASTVQTMNGAEALLIQETCAEFSRLAEAFFSVA
jgi:hypothetical protein